MKGATAEPLLSATKAPKSAKIIIIGNNQYFLLSLKKSQNPFAKLNIKIAFSLDQYFLLFLSNMIFVELILYLVNLFQLNA